MSAFRPRTTKKADLPHISSIVRKPEPLGTEFKCCACSKRGIMLHLEIQKGREAMARLNKEKMAGTACCLRMAAGTARTTNKECRAKKPVIHRPVPKQTFIGDSWFSSVQAATELALCGHHHIGVVKTAHSRFPKKFLLQTMQHWPAGSHLLLQATTREDIELCAVGCKCNKRKVMMFLFTKGAGHTEPGAPHEAKWKDEHGMNAVRHVPRPEVCAKCFQNSNTICVHNQSRQHDLKSEKHWVTQPECF